MEWTPKGITAYLDGEQWFRSTDPKTLPPGPMHLCIQLDWFPGCNAVYFRVGWARVEPKDGQYDWDYTDRVARRWAAKGRQVGYSWIVFSTIA